VPGTRAPRGRIRGAATAIVGVLLGVLVGLAQPGAAFPTAGGSASTRLAERHSGELTSAFHLASRPGAATQTSTKVAEAETRAPGGRAGIAADLAPTSFVARSQRGPAGLSAAASRDEGSGSPFADVRAPPGPRVA
jgi:hypothetical protein